MSIIKIKKKTYQVQFSPNLQLSDSFNAVWSKERVLLKPKYSTFTGMILIHNTSPFYVQNLVKEYDYKAFSLMQCFHTSTNIR